MSRIVWSALIAALLFIGSLVLLVAGRTDEAAVTALVGIGTAVLSIRE